MAREYKTPFVNELTQKLEETRIRLTQLIDLRNKDHNKQDIDSFLTPSEKKAFGAIDRMLNPERLRINLLLASLYLTAYEVLMNSIIQRIDDFFVPISDDFNGPPHLKDNHQQLRSRMESRYEQEVDQKFSAPINYKLIPSCKWLQKNGVISSEEIDEIKKIRDHRHHLAHTLPELIFSEIDLVVDIGHFMRIRELLKKIQLFWIRIDMDSKGIGEDVSDDDISGGWDVLDLIISTVFNYLNESQENESG
ncbi:hypothetical protein MNBD_CHLOROFLEXI01-3923 [hydrothermal vent metagenome]|uniref:Uncharacterized protein n=1 Tax=hydrothermal vent metagenome TaxID=652676 RepID=A0A3B0USI0_9ZZZZ